ncbi:SiaC family regulatory phosphoprotein, partial [Pantoea ananatis]
CTSFRSVWVFNLRILSCFPSFRIYRETLRFRAASLAQSGCTIVLNWFYDAEDDVSEEFGEELSLDFTALTVKLHAEQRQ